MQPFLIDEDLYDNDTFVSNDESQKEPMQLNIDLKLKELRARYA